MDLADELDSCIVCGDGAMGTLLFDQGVPLERCLEELSVSEPERIRAIHNQYIAAGARVIETNTFGANSVRLERFGPEAPDAMAQLLQRVPAGDLLAAYPNAGHPQYANSRFTYQTAPDYFTYAARDGCGRRTFDWCVSRHKTGTHRRDIKRSHWTGTGS